MRVRSLRVVGAMLVAVCVVTSAPVALAWAAPTAPDECHECCPEGLRPARAETCCVVAPQVPDPQAAFRVHDVTGGATVQFLPVVAWNDAVVAAADIRTADPPLRSVPMRLRTSVLLI